MLSSQEVRERIRKTVEVRSEGSSPMDIPVAFSPVLKILTEFCGIEREHGQTSTRIHAIERSLLDADLIELASRERERRCGKRN